MELILLKDVVHVGRKGDVVKVRDGFARNFLIPLKSAMAATRSNQEFVEDQRKRSVLRREKEKTVAQNEAKKMQQVKLSIEAHAGEQGKLFGSVTSEDIAEALKIHGFTIAKKQIILKEPIRSIGTSQVTIELYPGVKTTVAVEVVSKPS